MMIIEYYKGHILVDKGLRYVILDKTRTTVYSFPNHKRIGKDGYPVPSERYRAIHEFVKWVDDNG